MIIKPINPPTLAVSAQGVPLGSGSTQINSLMPLFSGTCTLEADSKEIEDSFKFSLFDGDLLITSSDWVAHKVQQADTWYCNTVLTHRGSYSILYEIKTNNGYYAASEKKTFTSLSSTIGTLDVNFQAVENRDNARVDLYISKNEETNFLTGNFVISRTSEQTNFQKFDDIKFLTYNMQSIERESVLAFSDYTIESGITYQYAIQQVLTGGNRTNVRPTERVCINFENAYLFRDEIQLRLSFNQNVSSFKHTVLRNKQDTLGDKYPHLSQNGNAYYSEFQISGLISYQDNVDSFFRIGGSGLYYRDELILSTDKFEMNTTSVRKGWHLDEEQARIAPRDHKDMYDFGAAESNSLYAYSNDNVAFPDRRSVTPYSPNDHIPSSSYVPSTDYLISSDLTDNNIYIERKFREKAEEFLNDFSCKLYRSATEGNIVVALMNVTLKPVESLGRMLYEFSATAYEVMDNSLEELDKYGIISIGEEQSEREVAESLYSFGQIRVNPLRSANENRDTINITDLIKEDAYFKVAGTTEEYALSDIKRIWIESDGIPITGFLKFSINGPTVLIPSRKIYTLNIPPKTSVESSSGNSYDGAIIELNTISGTSTQAYSVIINYMCVVSLQQQQTVDQVGSTVDILDFGQAIWNNEINDIISFIKDNIAQRNEFYTDEHGEWRKGDFKYTFDHIRAIDFETQIGAIIEIGKSSSDYETFQVGYRHNPGQLPTTLNSFESNRIFFPVLQDGSDIHSRYITLSNAKQAIINYTFEMRKQTISHSSE